MLQFPRVEILRAELAFLQLNSVPKQYLAVLQDEAQILYETFADDVLQRKDLATVCEFQELQMAFNNSCSFRHLFRNYCQLNYTQDFEAYLISYVLQNYQVDLHEFRTFENKQAFDYQTRYLQFSGTLLDRVLSYGVLALLALILDVAQLYDESSVLKMREMQILPLSYKNDTRKQILDDSLQFEEYQAKKVYELRQEYSDFKQQAVVKRKSMASVQDQTVSATESSSPQLFGQRYKDERYMLTLEQQEKDILRLNGEVIDLKAAITKREEELKQTNEKHEYETKAFVEEIHQCKEQIEKLTAVAPQESWQQNDTSLPQFAELKEEISRLQDVIQQMSRDYQQLLDRKEAESEIEQLRQSKLALQDENDGLRADLAAQKTLFENFKYQAQDKLLKLDGLIQRQNAIIEQLYARPKPKEISEVAQFVINDLENQILTLKDQLGQIKVLYQESKLQVVEQKERLEAQARGEKELNAYLEEVKLVNYQLLCDLQGLSRK